MPERVLSYAKTLAEEIADEGDLLVDATCGNGHDTKFLAELTGKSGNVLSFDIQKEAIDKAEELCKDMHNIEFIHDSHAHIDRYLHKHSKIKAAMFNLGYLPKGDKSITTEPATTIECIGKLFNHMVQGGRIIIVVYHGHSAGKIEKEALTEFLSGWSQKSAQILEYRFINQMSSAPFTLCIEKIID